MRLSGVLRSQRKADFLSGNVLGGQDKVDAAAVDGAGGHVRAARWLQQLHEWAAALNRARNGDGFSYLLFGNAPNVTELDH